MSSHVTLRFLGANLLLRLTPENEGDDAENRESIEDEFEVFVRHVCHSLSGAGLLFEDVDQFFDRRGTLVQLRAFFRAQLHLVDLFNAV